MRFTHASGLHAVERALDALHLEMIRSTETEGSVRLAVANIVAAGTDHADAEHAVDVLCALGEGHPARAIVILAMPEREPSIEADISFHCRPGTERICTELVRLIVQGEPALHLASIVTPLLIPDIDVHLWLVGAPRLAQAFRHDTVTLCERIVLDSGRYDDAPATLGAIADELVRHGADLSIGDIAWERSRIWRELCAQSFDGATMLPFLSNIESIDIASRGSAPSSQAWLLAGWLSSRLRWPEHGRPRLNITCSPQPKIADADLVSIRLACAAQTRDATVSLERHASTIVATVTVGGAQLTSRAISIRDADDTELVGGLIADGGDDRIYADAVAQAVELASEE